MFLRLNKFIYNLNLLIICKCFGTITTREMYSDSWKYLNTYTRNILWTILWDICESCKTFWNFISRLTKRDYRNYVGKILNESENVCKDNKMPVTSIHCAKLMETFEQSIINRISEPQLVVSETIFSDKHMFNTDIFSGEPLHFVIFAVC